MRNFDDYFLKICNTVGEMSTCERGHVGCVIVKDRRILTTGYAGSPSGMAHCDEIGHEMENGHCVRTVHAEQNAIIQAAKHGVSTDGATAYVTMVPCYTCAKMLVNAGIKRVVADNLYRGSEKSIKLFTDTNTEVSIAHNKYLY
jgi:dCMP deaminase